MKYQIFILYLLLTVSFQSCQKSLQKEMIVQGNIKGLTKGTLYLDKLKDSVFTAVDSFNVRDNGQFTLGDNIESPEIYHLRIKEKANEFLLIFGEKGRITVNSKLDKFATAAKISGSTNQDLLSEYKKMIQKFNDKRLDLFKANFEAEKEKNQKKLDSLDAVYKNLIRKRYLYTTNFALTHADKEVAPYLALTELYNAKIQLLDTVNNTLSTTVKESKYGKQLADFIAVIKKNETSGSAHSVQDLLN